MGKKLTAIILSLVLVVFSTCTAVRAADYVDMSISPYTSAYGSCWISQTTAGACTYCNPPYNTTVAATLSYIINPDDQRPDFRYWDNSDGGSGYASVYYSINSSYECYSISASHAYSGTDCSASASTYKKLH